MISLLDRYVVKEFSLPLVVGVLFFLFALAMDQLLGLLDLVLNRGVPLPTVLKLMGCLVPSIIAVALPMAALLASVLAFGRLAHDRELLAFKGAGISLWRMSLPLLLIGAALSVALAAFNGTVLPEANVYYKRLFFSILQTRATVAFKERMFIREFDKYLLYFSSKEEPGGFLRDVYIVERFQEAPPRLITARRGQLMVDSEGMKVTLRLEEGVAEQPSDLTGRHLTRVDFGTYEMGLGFQEALARVRFFSKGSAEMGYAALLSEIGKFRELPAQRRPFEVELHKRVAVAFAMFFVVLVGVPLGSLARRGGGVGVMLGLSVIFLYYFLLTMGQGWASRGVMPAWLGLWLPNMAMLLLGALAFRVALTESRWARWGR